MSCRNNRTESRNVETDSITSVAVTPEMLYSQQAQPGQAFMNQQLAILATSGRDVASLNLLQRVTVNYNVFVQEGMEPLWERIKTTYNLRVQADWVVTFKEEQLMDLAAMAMDGPYNILFICPPTELTNTLVMASSGLFAFVDDPQNVLGRR
jgi:hypothetical protein